MPPSATAHAAMTHDVFISHASEDKAAVARPLARALEAAGLSVWLDEAEITLGDSLRGSLDKGLAECRFGVVILSRDFFRKNWPQKELNGLAARENSGAKVILPVWHGLAHDDVLAFSPMLADRVAVSTEHGVDAVAAAVVAAVARGGVAGGVQADGAAARVDPLDALRARLLQAPDREALRRLGYEVEALARTDPASHEARWLQDQVHEAIERETIRTHLRPHAPAHATTPAPRRGLAPFVLAVVALLIVVLAVTASLRAARPAGEHARLASSVAAPSSVAASTPPPGPAPLHGVVHAVSDRGDPVGGGRSFVFNDTNSRFSATGTPKAISVEISSNETWTFDFAAPADGRLKTGIHDIAQRPASRDPAQPGLDISAAGRRCRTVAGTFSIVLYALDKRGAVDRLIATFEQHCDGKAAALRGSLELSAAAP